MIFGSNDAVMDMRAIVQVKVCEKLMIAIINNCDRFEVLSQEMKSR